MTLLRPSGPLTIDRFDSCLVDGHEGADLRNLNFADAFGLVGAAILLLKADAEGTSPTFRAPDRPQVAEHLSYMGFNRLLDALDIAHSLPDRDPVSNRDVVVPLEVVDDLQGADHLLDLLHRRLDQKVNPQVLTALTEGLGELAENALVHSGARPIVAGQVYPRILQQSHDETVQLVIGDAGCGIRAALIDSGRYKPGDDAAALDLATDWHVSSISDQRGIGLPTTVDEVTSLEGRLVLRSGRGRLDAGQDRRTTSTRHLSGTLVGVSLPLHPGS